MLTLTCYPAYANLITVETRTLLASPDAFSRFLTATAPSSITTHHHLISHHFQLFSSSLQTYPSHRQHSLQHAIFIIIKLHFAFRIDVPIHSFISEISDHLHYITLTFNTLSCFSTSNLEFEKTAGLICKLDTSGSFTIYQCANIVIIDIIFIIITTTMFIIILTPTLSHM